MQKGGEASGNVRCEDAPSVAVATMEGVSSAQAPAAGNSGLSGPLLRLRNWTGLLTQFLSLELLIQAIGFVAGLVLVRALPKAEYAFFTIANTMQQTMNLLADSGVSSGLTAIGGRVWNDRTLFGRLLRTAMRLRHVLALLGIVIVTPVLFWMLLSAGASFSYAAVLCASVLVALYCQLTIGVLIVAPLLHLEATRVQRLYLWSAALRLAIIAAGYLLFLNATVALLAGAASFALQEFLLRRWLPQYANPAAPPDAAYRREILGIIKNQAPNAVYYCIQSQLAVWVIGLFGSASGVADLGALGRLGMLFLVAGSVMTNIILPRFARVQDPGLLWRRYWQIVAAFVAMNAALLVVASAAPDLLLWLLGPKYAHLRAELFLMCLGTAVWSILGAMYHLNVTRGWIVSPKLLIPIGFTTELLLIVSLDMSQLRNVLLLGIYSTIPGFALNLWRTWKGIQEANRAAVN